MHRYLRTAAVFGLALSAALLGADCPQLSNLTVVVSGETTVMPSKLVVLRIVNRSGYDAVVEARFFSDGNEVRETGRWLAASGEAATDFVAPTKTDSISIIAMDASAGGTLAGANIPVDPDTPPMGLITFVVPATGGGDCNQNGQDDVMDIMLGQSQDCGHNGIPDECESSPPPVKVVVGHSDQIFDTDRIGSVQTELIRLSDFGTGSLEKLALDRPAGTLYFTTLPSVVGNVYSLPFAGGAPTPLVLGQEEIAAVGVNGGANRLYWSVEWPTSGDGLVRGSDLGGGGIGDVLGGMPGEITSISVDWLHGKLYFAVEAGGGASGSIRRVNLDGSGSVEILVTGHDDIRDVEVWPEAGLIFWAEFGPGQGIYRADLDGGGSLQIVGLESATGVGIDRDGCEVYWCGIGIGSPGTGFVGRADLDGGGVTSVVTGLDVPRDVAVYTVGGP